MKLACFNLFTFAALACVQTQLMPFLNDLNVTPFQKSIVLGVSALVAFGLAFLIGKISDTSGKIKPFFIGSLFFYNLFFIGAVVFSSLFFQLVFLTFMFACLKQVMSCAETMVFQLKQKDFGKYHAVSAIGLVVGALISGWLYQALGSTALMIMCVLLSCLSFFFSRTIQEKRKKKSTITIRQIKQLFLNSNFLLLLFVLFFLMLIGFADQFLVTDKLLELGAKKTTIALKYAIQALMELPIYFFSAKILKKFSPYSILIFTSIMSGLKFYLYAWVNTQPLILVVSTLQLFTHPLIVYTSKVVIQQITPSELAASSQLVGFAVYFSLAGFVSPLLGQVFVQQGGYSFALTIFSLLAVFPFSMSLVLKKRMTSNNNTYDETGD